MSVLKVAALGVPVGVLASGSLFFYATRHIEAVQLSPSDSIFKSKYHQKYNPNNNPTVHDLHIRRVPILQIDPTLLQNQESLIERYTGGVWAGVGFSLQRILLSYFSNQKAHELWRPAELLESKYHPGTTITNELVVLTKSQDRILIRGGDKVSKDGLRPMDALIELSVQLEPEENYVQFGFKSLFFQGLGTSERLPMPAFVVWLHDQYAKALLESGVRYVLKER